MRTDQLHQQAADLRRQAQHKRDEAVTASRNVDTYMKHFQASSAKAEHDKIDRFNQEAEQLEHLASQKEDEARLVMTKISVLDRQIHDLQHQKNQLMR